MQKPNRIADVWFWTKWALSVTASLFLVVLGFANIAYNVADIFHRPFMLVIVGIGTGLLMLGLWGLKEDVIEYRNSRP